MASEKVQLFTVKGYDLFEVVSAFQKEVRRCNVDGALYWGIELHLSGYAAYAWKRMLIMAIEDIGVVNPNLATHINSLHDIAKKLENKNDRKHQDRLPFIQAIVMLAESKKSRYIDWLLNVKFDEHFHKDFNREIPEYALDIHTRRGKQKGKTINDFFTEGSLLNQYTPYKNEDELKDTCKERWNTPNFNQLFPKFIENKKSDDIETKEDTNNGQATLF